MHNRPDRPLVVKCTFDRWNKRITFSSARNCSYDLLRNKVEQCFSLYATSYVIAYKDDDGEVTDITTESDLTEAIQYFQAGTDDPPLSSAASILSGRSFGSRRITLRVHITVDYDGPSLSDTSSLASMEEYKGRNGSQQSFSFGAPTVELDDDSVTVSSRDTGAIYTNETTRVGTPHTNEETQEARWKEDNFSLNDASSHQEGSIDVLDSPGDSSATMAQTWRAEGPFADEYGLPAESRYPENPEAVFERLRLQEEGVQNPFENNHPLSSNGRGAAWLRDQNARTLKYMLGATPEPSESDGRSFIEHQLAQENLGGDLALERDPRGKYYYSYTSSASQTHDSGYEDNVSIKDDIGGQLRPTSMQLNWLAAQQIVPETEDPQTQTYSKPSPHRTQSTSSEPIPCREPLHISPDIPPEVLNFVPVAGPPPDQLTDCSECGVLLDAIRYVCSTCGEKRPVIESRLGLNGSGKGKGKSTFGDHPELAYPPHAHRTNISSSPSQTFYDSVTLSTSPYSRGEHFHNKPLPSLPPLTSTSSSSPTYHSNGQAGYPHLPSEIGYELCSGCVESAGVIHALCVNQASADRHNNSNNSPSSPEDVMSQWRRSAPKQKGQLRHAYFEKVWGHNGWEDVEQDEVQGCRCSTCSSIIVNKRYKCTSCQKFNLCRACYSQVHDIHPSHAFLVVLEKLLRSRSEPDFLPTISHEHESHGEQSMKHPGVKCAHCMQDILGARFHCAICDSVDICSNCESAGLPGNLDSSDGGHISSHIMIKIPYPLETTEVQTASRRAIHLWTGRDAANVLSAPRSKPGSVYSSYAQTVVGSRHQPNRTEEESEDHQMTCNGCNKNIRGIRYQCATCPSSPTPYSLCASCEERSYSLHDAMHAFFKLPRRVVKSLSSPQPFLPKLYKVPAGPVGGLASNTDPREYLSFLVHSTALCDRCMERINGAWFRCAYCAKDLCGDCEALDTHDQTHIFVVFKAPVDLPHFRQVANLENPNHSPPIIPFAVY
ncbi:hypothetical protein BJ138DRAFT_1145144 [Hygrophoropsis aurantiaca]|uniref:Uncharacterized protein n=1 Tax=Hygrophoropsis aurantiaca TaxID=72124 RepID=A0ACB8AKT2_9AGAM|nr:hypothetical protein BJ138DRAFT_1145144 [Hygrophoropsis aurantiaca]